MVSESKKLFYLVLSSLLLFCIFLFYGLDTNSKYISIFSILICILFLFKFRRDLPILILFIFISSYSFQTYSFFFNGVFLTIWPDFQNPNMVNKVLLLDSIFIVSLGNSIKQNLSIIKLDFNRYIIRNYYLFYLNIIICISIIFWGIRGESLLQGAIYGSIEKSPLNEYFIVFFLIVNLTLPSENRFNKFLLFILYLMYATKNVIYGGRIEVLQLTLLLIYLYWIIPGKVKKRLIYSILFFGIYAVSVVGRIRSNPIDFLEGNYFSYLNPLEIFSLGPSDAIYLNSNQGDVIQSSARILGLIDLSILDFSTRLISFAFYLFSAVLPSSILPDFSNLASFKQDIYRSGGGGLIAVYFYNWLSFIGPILSGIFIGYSINKVFNTSSIARKIYGLMILVTFPRWYAYNPIFLVKFCIYAVFLYLFFRFIHESYFIKKT